MKKNKTKTLIIAAAAGVAAYFLYKKMKNPGQEQPPNPPPPPQTPPTQSNGPIQDLNNTRTYAGKVAAIQGVLGVTINGDPGRTIDSQTNQAYKKRFGLERGKIGPMNIDIYFKRATNPFEFTNTPGPRVQPGTQPPVRPYFPSPFEKI